MENRSFRSRRGIGVSTDRIEIPRAPATMRAQVAPKEEQAAPADIVGAPKEEPADIVGALDAMAGLTTRELAELMTPMGEQQPRVSMVANPTTGAYEFVVRDSDGVTRSRADRVVNQQNAPSAPSLSEALRRRATPLSPLVSGSNWTVTTAPAPERAPNRTSATVFDWRIRMAAEGGDRHTLTMEFAGHAPDALHQLAYTMDAAQEPEISWAAMDGRAVPISGRVALNGQHGPHINQAIMFFVGHVQRNGLRGNQNVQSIAAQGRWFYIADCVAIGTEHVGRIVVTRNCNGVWHEEGYNGEVNREIAYGRMLRYILR